MIELLFLELILKKNTRNTGKLIRDIRRFLKDYERRNKDKEV